jgi:excisionase family DNA binding protein
VSRLMVESSKLRAKEQRLPAAGPGASSKVEATGSEIPVAAALTDAAMAKGRGGGEQIQLLDVAAAFRTFAEMSLLATKEAAQILGVTPVLVRQLIKAKRLVAEKHGRNHLLQDREVERFKRHGRRSGPKGGRRLWRCGTPVLTLPHILASVVAAA